MTTPSNDGPHGPQQWQPPVQGGQWQAPSGGFGPQPPQPPQPPPPPQSPSPTQQRPHDYPGIIPFRPLALGDIYSAALKAIRANPIVMFGFSAVIIGATTAMDTATIGLGFGETLETLDRLANNPTADVNVAPGGGLFPGVGGFLIMVFGLILSFVGQTILTGILTYTVSQSALGFKPTLGQVWDASKGQMLRLIALAFVTSLAMVLGVIVAFILLIPAIITGSVLFAVLGLLASAVLMIAWAIFVLTATSLATPALMLERAKVFTSLKRSWNLTKPAFWRVLGIILLTTVMVQMVAGIVGMPFSIFGQFLSVKTSLILQAVGAGLGLLVVTPFLASAITLLYIDLRIRQEDLATELAAASQ